MWKENSDKPSTNQVVPLATGQRVSDLATTSFNLINIDVTPAVDTDSNSTNDIHLHDFTHMQSARTTVGHTAVFRNETAVTSVDPEVVAEHWSLNAKQKIAYRLIVTQCDRSGDDEALSMIITGAAGTGKSRIIHAAQDFMRQRNEGYRFRLASFTGIAAQNIEGVTLHSALALSSMRNSTFSTMICDALRALWAHVDFLFINEYSMVG